MLPPRPGPGGSQGDASSQEQGGDKPAGTSSLAPKGGLKGLPPRGLGAKPAAADQPAQQESQPSATASPAAGLARGSPAGLGGLGLAPQTRAAAPSPAAAAAPAASRAPAPAPSAAPVTASPAAPSSAPAASQPPRPSVVDRSEDVKVQKIQQQVHDYRVRLIRAAARLGVSLSTETVVQFLQAIERTERMLGAQIYKGTRSVNVNSAAEQEARQRDSSEPADSSLDLHIKVLLIGMTGTGKSELINALLGRSAARTNCYTTATKGVKVVTGKTKGITISFIDTPGLHSSAAMAGENRGILRNINRAYKKHKPDYVFYVDRLDASRPALGELSVLALISEGLGPAVWRNTMAVLTHANAARQVWGPQYDQLSRQRRNILTQLVRQAGGEQSRNPIFLVDSHPDCPRNSFGQPVVVDNNVTVAWARDLLLQLVGYKAYNSVVALLKAATPQPKGATAQRGGQADMFRQMMRSRLPPLHFFLEQLTEGVLKPEGWATMEDPLAEGTEDEEAEAFNHVYYRLMYDMAKGGDPWAQREYAAMLLRLAKLRSEVLASHEEAELNAQMEYGPECYLTDPIDFGPTFDPEDLFSHRHSFPESGSSDIQVIPSQDYYGPEHEDPLNGLVLQYEGQPFNQNGWGGIPMDLTLCLEKDKNSVCLQGETHMALVHSVPPFGSRHITQVCASWEMLRPNIKDVMYQLEVDTFKDGLLARNDHAGCGLMLARLGEGGKLNKGPVGVGVRLQDSFRLGAFKVEACASKVQVDAPNGGKEEGWGARAFVHYDWIPGLGMTFDFFQERSVEEAGKRARGYAANFTYDWEVLGAAWDVEVDHVFGSDAVQVGMNIFSGNDYRLAWLLAIPAWNYVKARVKQLLQGRQEMLEEEEVEEVEEEEEGMAMAMEGAL